MNSVAAIFNSERQAEQARAALLKLGLLETHIVLEEMVSDSSGDARTNSGPISSSLTPESRMDRELHGSLPSREFSSLQTADPTLTGSLIGGGVQGYNSVDAEMQNADFNQHELDAGLYQMTLTLEGDFIEPSRVEQVLEQHGGRIHLEN